MHISGGVFLIFRVCSTTRNTQQINHRQLIMLTDTTHMLLWHHCVWRFEPLKPIYYVHAELQYNTMFFYCCCAVVCCANGFFKIIYKLSVIISVSFLQHLQSLKWADIWDMIKQGVQFLIFYRSLKAGTASSCSLKHNHNYYTSCFVFNL